LKECVKNRSVGRLKLWRPESVIRFRNKITIGGQYRGGDKEGTNGETANGQTEQNRSEVGDRPPKRRGTKVQGSELFKRSEIGSIDPIYYPLK
jgi:hypothetical protein